MIGSSFRFLADVLEEGTAAAVMQSRVFMGLKSFVILRMTAHDVKSRKVRLT